MIIVVINGSLNVSLYFRKEISPACFELISPLSNINQDA